MWRCGQGVGELVGGARRPVSPPGIALIFRSLSSFSTRALISPEVGGEFVKQTVKRPHPRGQGTGSSSGRVGASAEGGGEGGDPTSLIRPVAELITWLLRLLPTRVGGFPQTHSSRFGVGAGATNQAAGVWMEGDLGGQCFWLFLIGELIGMTGKGLRSGLGGCDPRMWAVRACGSALSSAAFCLRCPRTACCQATTVG